MLDPSNESDQLILKLIKSIYATSGIGWGNVWHVSKKMEGSEEFIPYVVVIAQLPQAQPYITLSRNEKMVRLTELTVRNYHSLMATLEDRKTGTALTSQIAQAVKTYASTLNRLYLDVESVSFVGRADTRYVQAVTVKKIDEDAFPTETPVEYCQYGLPFIHGRIVGQEPEGNILYIAFDKVIHSEDKPAKLSIDRAYLLHNLASSIEELRGIPSLANSLIEEDGVGIKIAREDSLDAADQLAKLSTPWTRFLWGPPGAGKTYALGRLIIKLLEKKPNSNILLIAPSNLAADVALEQFLVQLSPLQKKILVEDSKVLRYGYPRKSTILSEPSVLGPPELNHLTQIINKISSRLSSAAHEGIPEGELSLLKAELLAKQEELRRLLSAHIAQCRLVVTTTAQTYLKASPLSHLTWDTVLVDEVTMVPPAVCFFLSSIAKERLLLAGDPRQLGPIYESRTADIDEVNKWLGNDIFDVAGLSRQIGEQRTIVTDDPRMARITSQRRCTSSVWSLVSHLYPGVTSRVNEEYNEPLLNLAPMPGNGMVLLDTSSWSDEAQCVRLYSSWCNPFSALLAMKFAELIRGQSPASIAIIAPYRAQIRLIRQKLREEQRNNSPLATGVEAGTIHQFQGSEADVVIFDLVDGAGRKKLGKLLSGDSGTRLMNVAITRARGKCIIIANRDWCRSHIKRSDNPLLWEIITRPSIARFILPPPAEISQS